MKTIKKAVHWTLFLILAPLIICILSFLLILIPLIIGARIVEWSFLSFIIIGSLFLAAYYLILRTSMAFVITFISRFKPDFWISSIIMVVIPIFYLYSTLSKLAHLIVSNGQMNFGTLNRCLFFIAIVPAFLSLAYCILVMPFLATDRLS